MRALATKPNTVAPDSTYPYGRIRNKAGVVGGTKVNEVSYGDMHQFFEKLMAIAGIVANGLPDNAYNGFQLIDALINRIQFYVAAEATLRAAADASEASTRASADASEASARAAAISSEVTARVNADTTLQNNINALAQAFTTSGASYGAGVSAGPSFGFRLTGNGMVEMVGQLLHSGVFTQGQLVATLPPGYRPSAGAVMPVGSGSFLSGAGWQITIDTLGQLFIYELGGIAGGSPTNIADFSVEGVRFKL